MVTDARYFPEFDTRNCPEFAQTLVEIQGITHSLVFTNNQATRARSIQENHTGGDEKTMAYVSFKY